MRRLLPLLLSLSFTAGAAGDSALDRATLRGVQGVGVVIDRIDPELVKIGFDANALQSRIDVKLRSANVPVAENANEFLGLRLLHVRGGRGPYAICLSIGFYQPVVLVRDAKAKTATQTWEVETVLMAPANLVYSASLDSLDELIERFVAAWRSANPK